MCVCELGQTPWMQFAALHGYSMNSHAQFNVQCHTRFIGRCFNNRPSELYNGMNLFCNEVLLMVFLTINKSHEKEFLGR